VNLRIIGALVVAIIVLAVLGPENTANFISAIGDWATEFLNAL
jgi:Sec-independent protein translocase protein TatA